MAWDHAAAVPFFSLIIFLFIWFCRAPSPLKKQILPNKRVHARVLKPSTCSQVMCLTAVQAFCGKVSRHTLKSACATSFLWGWTGSALSSLAETYRVCEVLPYMEPHRQTGTARRMQYKGCRRHLLQMQFKRFTTERDSPSTDGTQRICFPLQELALDFDQAF